MDIKTWVSQTTEQLRDAGIESARLDAELLLCDNHNLLNIYDDTTIHSREEIITRGDEELKDWVLRVITKSAERRASREPMAYLLNHKEFYGRDFYVNREVLIPRPETEQLIEITKRLDPCAILDVGTGSGCIAATLAQELPRAQVTASDVSAKALDVAVLNNAFLQQEPELRGLSGNWYSFRLKKNRRAGDPQKKLRNTGMDIVQSDLLDDIEGRFDLIVANLPYIDAHDPTWATSPELEFEPKKALFAATHGTALMRKLIRQAPKNLAGDGFLLLEMDTRQLDTIASYANKHGFTEVERQPFALLLQRT
jgi:release factor glutamine methyltransferase